MYRLFFVGFLLTAIAETNAVLTAVNPTLHFRRLSIPGGNGEVALISVYFNRNAALLLPGSVQATRLSELKGVNVTTRPDGGQDAIPLLSVASTGLASLVCLDPQGGQREWNITGIPPNNGPPRDLMMAPPTEEPGSSFLSSLGGYTFDEEWREDRANFMILMEGWFDGNRLSNKGANRGAMASWECKLRFSNSTRTARLVDAEDGTVFAGETPALSAQENHCTASGIERIRKAFSGFMSAMQTNVTSKSQLSAMEMTSGAVTLFEAWDGCDDLIRSFFTPENGTMVLSPTTQCTERYGSPEFQSSPCCNQDLAYTQCCVPTAREMRYTKVGSLTVDSGTCRRPDAIAAVLASYVDAQESSLLAEQMAAQSDMGSRWSTYTEFIGQCNSELTSTTCVVDADCVYSKSCNQQSGTCNFDWENSQGAYAACFVDKMDPALRAELVRQYGLDALSDTLAEDFAAVFERSVFDLDCVGPTADRYRQRWSEAVDSQGNRYGYMVPANATGCLLEKQCNWNRWENTNEAMCVGEAVIDARGASFCGARNGGSRDLQDVSVPSQCQAVDITSEQECAAAGNSSHRWVSFHGSSGICIRKDLAALADCLSGPVCSSHRQRMQQSVAAGSYSPFSPDNWDPQCTSTMCYHQGWNQSFCESLRFRGSSLGNGHALLPLVFSLGWDVGTGVCGANLRSVKSTQRNETTCQALSLELGLDPSSFAFQEGHMFRPGQWSTEQECAVGRCNIPALSYYGVNRTTCEARDYCTQSCSRCKTFLRDQSNQNERTLCYNPSANSSQYCQTPGLWQQQVFVPLGQGLQQNGTTHDFCVFPYTTRVGCEEAGLVFKSCSDLSSASVCQLTNSAMPWQYRLLQCVFDTHTDCLTREECEQQGQCNDWDMQSCSCSPSAGCVCNSGACVQPWDARRQQCGGGGNEFNQAFRPTRFGCMDTSVVARTQCESKEGGSWTWHEKAYTEEECYAHGSGCKPKEARWGGQLIGRNSSECTRCGGRPEPQYRWTRGRVVPGQQQELVWTNRSWVSTNQLKHTLSFNKLQQVIGNGVAAIFAREMMNRLNVVVQKKLATFVPVSRCCTPEGEVAGDDCFPVELVPDAQCTAEPGFQEQVCESPSGSILIPPDSVQSQSGVVISTSVILYGTAVANATQGDLQQQVAQSRTVQSRLLMSTRKEEVPVTTAPVSNDVVRNALGNIVGEIVSNALVVAESPNVTFPLKVCIPVLANAEQETGKYPVRDFCAITLLVGPPQDLGTHEEGINVCANITSFGAYFVCNRLSDWSTYAGETQQQQSESSETMPSWELATIISASAVVGVALFAVLASYWINKHRVAYKPLGAKLYNDA